MNHQSESTDNFTPRSIKQSYHHRLLLIIASLLVILGAGYLSWRELP